MITFLEVQKRAHKKYLKTKKNKNFFCQIWGLLFSVHCSPSVEIGERTTFGYGGLGIVIHDDCVIGKNCLIAQNVTLGGRAGHVGVNRSNVPILEDDVYIGAGAKILGPVTIGKGAVIGANAVVLKDVPPYEVWGGIPAKYIRAVREGEIYR